MSHCFGPLVPRRCDGRTSPRPPLAYISAAASDHRAEMEGVSLFYREPAPKASRPLPRAQMAELCWRWQGVEIRVLVW